VVELFLHIRSKVEESARKVGACIGGSRSMALELILEWGRRGEARRPIAGGGVLGEGTASPSPPTRGFAGVL